MHQANQEKNLTRDVVFTERALSQLDELHDLALKIEMHLTTKVNALVGVELKLRDENKVDDTAMPIQDSFGGMFDEKIKKINEVQLRLGSLLTRLNGFC